MADVDGDGDLDVFAASISAFGSTAWVENVAGDGSLWSVHTIATGGPGIWATRAADVDHDGDIDAVSSGVSGGVRWFENAAADGSTWVVHTIATQIGGPALAAADMDGDGDTDVVSAELSAAGVIRVHENLLGDGSRWAVHTVFDLGFSAARSMSAADMDGDGDLDVVDAGSVTAWHENLTGNGSTWAKRTINPPFTMDTVAAVDVDQDGDLDVLGTRDPSAGLGWFRNDGGAGQSWTFQTIMSHPAAAKLAAGDVDGDGDVDAVSSNASYGTVFWHENVDHGGAWTTHTVMTSAHDPTHVLLADTDGDGDNDITFTLRGYNNERIEWVRNESIHQSACFAPVRTIFSMDTPFGASAADVDRDGDLDVFTTSFVGNSSVNWHRNDAEGSAWTPFTIATNRSTFFANVADVDADGDADAFLGPDAGNPASWVDNAGGGSGWPIHAVGTPGDFSSLALVGADLDGDGDTDALLPPYSSDLISWRENLDGQGLLWLPHTIATTADGGAARPVDLDRDGDLDILAGQTPLTWHANAVGNGTMWTTHTISATGASFVLALDLDSDGDLDVIGVNISSSPGVRWHENLAGNGTSWATHTLSTLLDFFSIESRDVDRDGDEDLVGSGGSAGPVWLERTGPGVSFVLRTVATGAGTPGQVSVADIDGDGGPDVLWASQTTHAVFWNRNGHGQVLIDLLDQVPTTVGNGDVFPILRLTVTHGGRAGDSDLELARLGLLFEEEPGDPLTSAEANALVEELRVYRDANGNGTFEPGIDTLVATVPTLALTAGVQTLTFSDGDPNVQVAFGSPRTFFVVAQLTGNANQQVPHQFRATHLATGPSATRAEDRNADIPLMIACPADFPSRLIVAVPVELIDFTIE